MYWELVIVWIYSHSIATAWSKAFSEEATVCSQEITHSLLASGFSFILEESGFYDNISSIASLTDVFTLWLDLPEITTRITSSDAEQIVSFVAATVKTHIQGMGCFDK